MKRKKFRTRILNCIKTFAYELSENKEPEENLFEDDEDDNGDDADKEYLNNVYKGKIAEFFASIEPDGCNGDDENEHDENEHDENHGKDDGGDEEDEHVLMYDISNDIEDPIYDFDFSKLLSLITEKQYNEFLRDDEKENNKDEDDDDDDDEDEPDII